MPHTALAGADPGAIPHQRGPTLVGELGLV